MGQAALLARHATCTQAWRTASQAACQMSPCAFAMLDTKEMAPLVLQVRVVISAAAASAAALARGARGEYAK